MWSERRKCSSAVHKGTLSVSHILFGRVNALFMARVRFYIIKAIDISSQSGQMMRFTSCSKRTIDLLSLFSQLSLSRSLFEQVNVTLYHCSLPMSKVTVFLLLLSFLLGSRLLTL